MSKHVVTIVKGATLMAALAAFVATSTPAPTDATFHPDYSKALTVEQMSAAWQAELDRLFPQPVTGGG